MVILCVPVGAMAEVAREIAPALAKGVVISDVGSSKQTVANGLLEIFPDRHVIPAHPVAGTEHSGPDAGFAALFQQRWCIVTPPEGADPLQVSRVISFWEALGAMVDPMDPNITTSYSQSPAISRI